jgi:hypothetical protein
MKRKLMISAALMACGMASQLNAQQTVYITGSTAFRSVVFQAITNSFDGGAVPTIATRDGSATSGNNGNYMVFNGTAGGVNTWITCHWTGSEDGIASVATPGSFPEFFLLTDGSVTGISSSKPGTGETNTVPIAPDFCFADSSQTVSLTPTPALTGMGTNSPAGICGVVPFVWAKNNNSGQTSGPWFNLTNINDSAVRKILSGKQKGALLTGVATDTTNNVYCVGRNNRSGTRVNALAISKFGVKTAVTQFTIGGNPSDGTLTLASAGFNNGYNSGGDVAKALGVSGSMAQADPITLGNTGWLAVGYLGIGDAKTLGTGFWLTYQGIPYNDGNVEEGHYNFWNYEYILGKPGISGYAQTLANNLANFLVPSFSGGATIGNQDTSVGLTFMNATKSSDTADPSHK